MYETKTIPGVRITTTTVRCHVCDRFGVYPNTLTDPRLTRKLRAQGRAHAAKSGHRVSIRAKTDYALLIEPQNTPEFDTLGRRLG
jgi:hypothetical protein